MSDHRRRNRRRQPNYIPIILALALVLTVLVGILLVRLSSRANPDPTIPPTDATTAPTTVPTVPSTGPTVPSTVPTEPEPVVKVGSATVTATGDMLMHMPCIRPAYVADTNTYDFTPYFTKLQDYLQASDYAVANLETTLCGLDNGFEYSGYPDFNCPDGLVTSLQSVGFDMLLTANNHSYDTGSVGFHRTQQVIRDFGMDYIGTVTDAEQKNYLIKELNGIRIGMICYTYETDTSDVVALNGAPLPDYDAPLINTFNEWDLDALNAEMAANIDAMEADGAEAIVLYIHWGEEYSLEPNAAQKTIAQNMCDLGVDVIVGGHPHVIQPMELLRSTTDSDHRTLCLYSTGNALSNQRVAEMNMKTGHTEDGILFSFTFAKYSDGTVRVEGVDVLPTWIWLRYSDQTGKMVYDVLPLDPKVADWKTSLGLTDEALANAKASYDRTMALVGTGCDAAREYLEKLPEPGAESQPEPDPTSILNFLQVAVRPVGSTMYVWGGGWNEADTGAGVEAVTLGVSDRWAEFAARQDGSYDYNTTKYQIHDGLDCSGYVGWAVYNVLETENGKPGYVRPSTGMARDFAARGLGTYYPAQYISQWQAGDIMSMEGHVWIAVGMCDDGSVLLLHASPPGVIFSGTNLPDGSKSHAVILAENLMRTYFPDWYARFPDCARPHSYLTHSSAMRWSEEVLSDRENLRQKTAEEVVQLLFPE